MAKLLTSLWSLCLCMNSYNYLILHDSRVCYFFVSPIRLQSPWGQRLCSVFLCLFLLFPPAPSSACPTLQCTLLNEMESGWQHSHSIACIDWPNGLPALPNNAFLGLGWLPVPEGNPLYSTCQMGFILLDSDFPLCSESKVSKAKLQVWVSSLFCLLYSQHISKLTPKVKDQQIPKLIFSLSSEVASICLGYCWRQVSQPWKCRLDKIIPSISRRKLWSSAKRGSFLSPHIFAC